MKAAAARVRQTPSPWCTTEEAASRLRKTPGAFHTWRWRNKNNPRRLKAYRVDGRKLFKVTDVDRLVQPDVKDAQS